MNLALIAVTTASSSSEKVVEISVLMQTIVQRATPPGMYRWW